MATINVTWDSTNNKPSAPDATLDGVGTGAQTITWVPDGTVTITAITPMIGAIAGDFTSPAQVPCSGNWQCTDNMANSGNVSYTIVGLPKGGGAVAGHDPQIRND